MKTYDVKKNKYGAITLLEVLLAIGLMTFLAGLSGIVFTRYLYANETESAKYITVHAFNNARKYAMTNRGDDDWGIRISNTGIVIFKGDDFDTRDMKFDEVFNFLKSVTIISDGEYIFEKFTGNINSTNPIIWGSGSLEHEIKINEKGIYFY